MGLAGSPSSGAEWQAQTQTLRGGGCLQGMYRTHREVVGALSMIWGISGAYGVYASVLGSTSTVTCWAASSGAVLAQLAPAGLATDTRQGLSVFAALVALAT